MYVRKIKTQHCAKFKKRLIYKHPCKMCAPSTQSMVYLGIR